MFVDVVFPRGNEAEFVSVAESLGYSGICFACDYQKDVNKFRQRIDRLKKWARIEVYLGLVAGLQDIRKAKKKCELVLVKGSEKSQTTLEKLPVDVLFGSEFFMRKDAMHYRASGLNQVLCRLAAKKGVVVGFDFRMIDEAADMPMVIGRAMQNVMLCKKYKTRMAIFSGARKPMQMRGMNDLMSFMAVLGLEKNKKKTAQTIGDKIKENIKKKMPTYIKEGVELVE